jgi:copper oxidase (laccase) domain-containing protein
VNNAQLDAFRQIAAAMQTAPTDWQWIGPHMSQRMFGITQERAEAFAARHGGKAERMQETK